MRLIVYEVFFLRLFLVLERRFVRVDWLGGVVGWGFGCFYIRGYFGVIFSVVMD